MLSELHLLKYLAEMRLRHGLQLEIKAVALSASAGAVDMLSFEGNEVCDPRQLHSVCGMAAVLQVQNSTCASEPLYFVLFPSTVVAMLGMLSPSSRGALMTTACFLFMFMG